MTKEQALTGAFEGAVFNKTRTCVFSFYGEYSWGITSTLALVWPEVKATDIVVVFEPDGRAIVVNQRGGVLKAMFLFFLLVLSPVAGQAEDYFSYCARPEILFGHKALHVGGCALAAWAVYAPTHDLGLAAGMVTTIGLIKEIGDWREGEPFWYGIGDLAIWDAGGFFIGVLATEKFGLWIGPYAWKKEEQARGVELTVQFE